MIAELLFFVLGAVILLGSGYGVLGLIPALRRGLTRIETIVVSLLVSVGVAGAWGLAGTIFGMHLRTWSIGLLALSVGLPLAALLLRRGGRTSPVVGSEPASYRLVLGLLALVALLLMLREGGSLGPVHDSLDFVAFTREILQTGDLSPESPLYRPDRDVAPDPRRGSFHLQFAALCRLSGVDPIDGWRWFPRLLAPLAVLAIAAMFRHWIGTPAAAMAAMLFFFTTFFNADRFIQNLGYASRFGWVCGWGGLLALGRGLALRRDAHWNESIALLALAAASPAILFFMHLLSGFQVLLALGCAGLAVWTWRGSGFEDRRAIWYVLGLGVLLLLPVVGWRILRSMDVANPLFDHLYGVMLVAGDWPVLHPDYLLERIGIAGAVGLLIGLGFGPFLRRDRAAGFLFWSTAVPLAILFLPPIVRVVVAAHAHSMLFRVILTIPVAGILAVAILRGGAALAGGGALRRVGGGVLLALALVGLLAQAVATRSEWAVPEKLRATHRENEPLVTALAVLDRELAEPRTILSDPISSYAVPAYTKHDAVAPLHQHSSPTDPSVPQRIRDVQAALNGRVGLARTFTILRRYDVDLILLNQSYGRYQSAYYVHLSPLAYEEQTQKFVSAPRLFEPIYDSGGITVYRVHDPGPEAKLPGDPPNPARIPDPGGAPLLAAGPVEMLRFTPPARPVPAGEPARFGLIWRRTDAEYRLPVFCEIKIQHAEMPESWSIPVLGRILRWVEEETDETVLRFGRPFRPLVNFYPVFLWSPGETYADERWEWVPPQSPPGRYEIWVRMGIEPYAPVDDFLELASDRLGPDWRRMGTLEIAAPREPAP
ncbi:MAG: hypothetical protein GF346_00900 [Candidatus Eisenbacteria bacterium]|nr:hypothetical protein [Candidatus Latescibacterota bacterium]MBD3300990.1 hypothetical protein [Candidatus Eisenbacteria bacterium]